MRNFQLALLFFICVAKCYGQTGTNSYGKIEVEITKEKKPKRIYAKVEIKSAFPGGDSSWVRTIENGLNQSLKGSKRIKKGKYIASVIFIVDKDGNFSEFRFLNDPPGFGIAEEIMRVLKKSPKWFPAPYPVKPYRTSSSTPKENN